jgi:tetratricopeptide (TPR) repeat protein
MQCCLRTVGNSGKPQCGIATAKPAEIRRGISTMAVLASLLIVALATVSVASTLVALRAANERDQLKEDYAGATRVIDQYIMTISSNNKLKGTSMEALRNDLYQPAFDYYEQYVKSHPNKGPGSKLENLKTWVTGGDKQSMPHLADAHFHLAGLLAKRGSSDSLIEINEGLRLINAMKAENFDPSTYPSFQQSALRYTMPTEWFTFKNVSGEGARDKLVVVVMAFDGTALTYEELKKAHPDVVSFRDDIAGASRIPGTMFGFANANARSAVAWQKAVDNLDSVVRDRPSDMEYKVRLAEALAALASRQKSMRKTEEAMANYQRVIDLREQIVAANPDDTTRKSELTTAKRDLERLKATKPEKKAEPPAEAAASATEPAATPAPTEGK